MCCYGVDRRICYGECYDDLRDVYETLVLHGGLDLLGQGAGDLGGIAAADVAVDALPLGNPGLLGVGDERVAPREVGIWDSRRHMPHWRRLHPEIQVLV